MTRFFALVGIMVWMSAALADDTIYTDPDKAAADFPFQGEYVGKVWNGEAAVKVGLQVGTLGESHYHATLYLGGLPGEGWDKKRRFSVDGKIEDGTLVFDLLASKVKIKDGVGVATNNADPSEPFRLDKVKRSSPTLGAKPPKGAVVLFDGKSADAFDGGKMTEDGLLEPGCTSKQKFGSCKLHIEFRTPLQLSDRYFSVFGQLGRGNSSFFVGGRYPVTSLDSFGLNPYNDSTLACAKLNTRRPDVDMCLPPLTWQTYDIDYIAAKFDGKKLVKSGRMTILHNGVVIHEDIELPEWEAVKPGPIQLVETSSPVRYRNIWVVDIEGEERERNKRAVEDALTRTWEDPTGKFKVNARLTAVLPGPVAQLTKDDGKVIKVKLFQLKTADRKWIIESGNALLEKLKEFK